MIDIDVIGLQPLQAAFDLLDEVSARRTDVVRPLAELEGCLRRDQNARPRQVFDRLAENFFRKALRVDIGRFEEIDARFHADIDEARGLFYVCLTPGTEKFIPTAESSGAKTKHRHLESTSTQLSEFHTAFDGAKSSAVAGFFAIRRRSRVGTDAFIRPARR